MHSFSSSECNDDTYYVVTTTLQCRKTLKPDTPAGFEHGIFCSVGGRGDHYETPLHFRSLPAIVILCRFEIPTLRGRFMTTGIILSLSMDTRMHKILVDVQTND
jgi:hypothetical protein